MLIENLRRQEFENRMKRISLAEKQKLMKSNKQQKDSLHVTYVMTHVTISGGAKIIFEHANHLKQLGAHVSIVTHFPKPDWFPINVEYIQIPFHTELCHGIPLCDIIIATYWDHIQACVETGIAPVVYFEQGDSHLFDYESIRPEIKQFIHKQFELPSFIFTVSNRAATFIQNIYNREALVFHNALNEKIFSENGSKHETKRPYLLMVGSDQTTFKGIGDIIEAHKLVKQSGRNMDLVWITPNPPTKYKDEVDEIFVSPTQEQIGELYRGASLYVSGSHYEAFPLPGLEAMACGCSVVTTNNDGVQEYAVDGYNSLFASIGNPLELATKILQVLNDADLCAELKKNGLETADRFKWSNIIPEIYNYYKHIATHQIVYENELDDWTINLTEDQFFSAEDREKFYSLLKNTKDDFIQLPFVHSIRENMHYARWTLAAERKELTDGKVHNFYLKVAGGEPKEAPHERALQLYSLGQYESSVQLLVALIQSEQDLKQRIVYLRWAILCLMELDNMQKALELLDDTLKVQTDNADLYYLYLLIHLWNKSPQEMIDSIIEVITLLGEAVQYPEFFVDYDKVLSK